MSERSDESRVALFSLTRHVSDPDVERKQRLWISNLISDCGLMLRYSRACKRTKPVVSSWVIWKKGWKRVLDAETWTQPLWPKWWLRLPVRPDAIKERKSTNSQGTVLVGQTSDDSKWRVCLREGHRGRSFFFYEFSIKAWIDIQVVSIHPHVKLETHGGVNKARVIELER